MTKKETPDVMLMNHLDELAHLEPAGFPFISLYLNLQPDQHGRDNFESFVRKEFKAKAKSYDRTSRNLIAPPPTSIRRIRPMTLIPSRA